MLDEKELILLKVANNEKYQKNQPCVGASQILFWYFIDKARLSSKP